MDSGRQYQNSAVRVRSPPPCRAIFFVKNRASVSNKPSAPSVRPTRRVAAIARTRAETSGQPAHALRYPRAFEQSFGHGHMWASHRPSATLASDTKEVAATTRAIHRYTGRDGLVAVTRNSAKTPRRRTGTSARAATTSDTLKVGSMLSLKSGEAQLRL